MVTADQAEVAALDATVALAPGTLFFDCNSCSPGAKRRSAEALEAKGISLDMIVKCVRCMGD